MKKLKLLEINMGSWEDYCEFCDLLSHIKIPCKKYGVSICEECVLDYLDKYEVCEKCQQQECQ